MLKEQNQIVSFITLRRTHSGDIARCLPNICDAVFINKIYIRKKKCQTDH